MTYVRAVLIVAALFLVAFPSVVFVLYRLFLTAP